MRYSKEQSIGRQGEVWVYNKLKSLGYPVQEVTDFFDRNRDLMVGNLPVEVKLSNSHLRRMKRKKGFVYRARWQWTVSETAAFYDGLEWVCVLLAKDDRDRIHPYVVPGSIINFRRCSNITLTSHPNKYQGWLAEWRDRWRVIPYLLQASYLHDGPLFQEWEKVVA